ncbi:MAG: hypothetical protein ACR2M5_06640 [Nakamurella sp.]
MVTGGFRLVAVVGRDGRVSGREIFLELGLAGAVVWIVGVVWCPVVAAGPVSAVIGGDPVGLDSAVAAGERVRARAGAAIGFAPLVTRVQPTSAPATAASPTTSSLRRDEADGTLSH